VRSPELRAILDDLLEHAGSTPEGPPHPAKAEAKPWNYDRSAYRCRGVPERAALVLGAGIGDNPARRALREARAADITFVVLEGDTGVGKTIAAAEAVMARYPYPAERLRTAPLMVHARDAVRACRESTPLPGHLWDHTRLSDCDLLALDDLGAEMRDSKRWASGVLGSLLESRHDRCLRTIVTTNITREEFAERYNDRLLARIQDGGRWVKVEGQDLRRSS